MFFRVCLCLSKQFILHRFSFYWLPFLFSYFSKHGSNFCWFKDFPGGSDGKSVCLQWGRPGFSPWVRKIPWRRKWHPTPVLLPGKSHGQRSLIGYSPWGNKESDLTEQLHFCWFRKLWLKLTSIKLTLRHR